MNESSTMRRQQSAGQMIKKAMQSSSSHSSLYSFFSKDPRHLYCLLLTALSFFLFFVLFSFSSSPTSPLPSSSSSTFFAAAALRQSPLPSPPSFAYFISGSSNDADRLLRLVFAIYHPKNVYLLHLDLDAPQEQRVRLARDLHAVPVFRSGRNVHVLGSADFVNPRGSSALASTLHGAAVLLRLSNRWDWFVNLSADDYPLVTQDDLLHVFSFLPKDLNFVQHSSYIGWKESRRLKHVIVDPGLYLSSKADVFFATQKRDIPNAYRIFTGSSSVIISRKFIEHIVLGTDSLPRSLLMYLANTPSSHTNYLQTVLCNTPEFNRTIINDHLRYLRPESPPKEDQNRQILDNLRVSGAAFGSGFSRDDPVLDMIDEHVLSRGPKRIVPGGWCLGRLGYTDPCGVWGSPDALIPGTAAARLVSKLVKLLANETLQSRHCLWDGSM